MDRRGESGKAVTEAPNFEERVNETCPWSGEPVSPESLTRYRGRVVGFCNPGCRDKFAAATSAFEAAIAAHDASADALNGRALEQEMAWFASVMNWRFAAYGMGETGAAPSDPPPPPPPVTGSAYAQGVAAAGLGPDERFVLILALLPHLRPAALDPLLLPNQTTGRAFTEFGGAPAPGGIGFRPTRQTALFLLGGEAMDARLAHMRLFASDAPLQARGILAASEDWRDPATPLLISREWLDRLIGGPARG